jgi:hypothetical protein
MIAQAQLAAGGDDVIMLLFCPTGQTDFGKSKGISASKVSGYRASGCLCRASDGMSACETHAVLKAPFSRAPSAAHCWAETRTPPRPRRG